MMAKIDVSGWEDFRIYDLFDINSGTKLDARRMTMTDPTVNFVGRSGLNNGVNCKVDIIEGIDPYSEGALTLTLGGAMIGACFIQDHPFYTSQNVVVLTSKEQVTVSSGALQFVAACITREARLNYQAFVKELNRHITRDFSFKLPVTPSGDPDWDYMESYVSKLRGAVDRRVELVSTQELSSTPVDISGWIDFRVQDLFEIISGKGVTKREVVEYEGDIPAIQSSAEKNGVMGYLDRSYCLSRNYLLIDEPCLTVARSGSVGHVTFQEGPCVIGDSAKALLPRHKMTMNSMLFLQAVLFQLQSRYSYGDKVTTARYAAEVIRLPATLDGKPSWDQMEIHISKIAASVKQRADELREE